MTDSLKGNVYQRSFDSYISLCNMKTQRLHAANILRFGVTTTLLGVQVTNYV